MPELPRSSKYRATPQAPLDDAERNQLVTRLNDAFEAGQVSQDDYRTLLDQVFAARVLGDVAPVVETLPGVATHETPALVPVGDGRPGELSEHRTPSAGAVSKLAVGAGVGVVVLLLLIALVILL